MDRAERVARELVDDLARWSDLDLTDKEKSRFITILRREFQAVWEEAAQICDEEANLWRVEEHTPTGRYSYDSALRAKQAEDDAAALRARAKEEA